MECSQYLLFALLVLGVYAFVMGNSVLAEYLHFPFIHGVGELAVICSIFMGCCLGFLWFNSFPAEVFMGDLGSLMLGGVMMTVSFLLRQRVALFIGGRYLYFRIYDICCTGLLFSQAKGTKVLSRAPFSSFPQEWIWYCRTQSRCTILDRSGIVSGNRFNCFKITIDFLAQHDKTKLNPFNWRIICLMNRKEKKR